MEIVPVAIEQVGSNTETVGVVDGVGIGLMITFNAGLVQPVLLFVIVIKYVLLAVNPVKMPVLFVDE